MKTLTLPIETLFQCAVYKIMRGQDCVYVGQTGMILGRFHHHHVVNKTNLQPGDTITFTFCDESELDSLESAMLEELRPMLNKHQVGGAGRPMGSKSSGDALDKLMRKLYSKNSRVRVRDDENNSR